MKYLAPWLAGARLQVVYNVFFTATGHISLGDFCLFVFCRVGGGSLMCPDISKGHGHPFLLGLYTAVS